LQPFSRRYFEAQSDFYTYADEWSPKLVTHLSAATTNRAQPNKMATLDITLTDLERLLRVPADVYFEHSLGVNFSTEQVTTEDHEVFSVDALAQWKIQQQLIKESIVQLQDDLKNAQHDTEIGALLQTLMSKQQRSGQLPIPPFADLYIKKTLPRLIKPLQHYQHLLTAYTENVPLLLSLTSDNTLITLDDQISDIWQQPGKPDQRIRCVLLSSQLWAGKESKTAKIKWHYLARLWPAHLAAQLNGPVSTHILGPDTKEILAPLDSAQARDILVSLINLWQKNLQTPLAACVKTSCAMLTTPDEKSPEAAAQSAYHGAHMSRGEVQDHYSLLRLWPEIDDLYSSGFTDHSYDLYGALTEHWLRHRRSAATAETEEHTA
jgi:exodeoxyribonuclease V gamma subunit